MRATLLILGRPDKVDDVDDSFVNTQIRNGIPYVLEIVQDPDSGAIERKWVVASSVGGTIMPDSDLDQNPALSFPCSARGFTDGGLRVVGTTERWSSRGTIQNIDTITLKYPKNMILSDRDRITNLRDKSSNKVLWLQENGKPSVFEVSGTTPIFDPFGNHIENSALMNIAQVQD